MDFDRIARRIRQIHQAEMSEHRAGGYSQEDARNPQHSVRQETTMREYRREDDVPSFNLQSLLQIIRAVGAILGVIAIVIGLVYATRMFGLVFAALHAPEAFQTHLDKWVTAVGDGELDIAIGGTTYHGARMIAIMLLGGGTFILAWLSMGIILAGAKTVSWTLSDREAVKKVLVHAFGPARKQEPNKPNGGDGK